MDTFFPRNGHNEEPLHLDAPFPDAGGQPDNNLRLSGEEMRTLGYRVIDILVEHFDSLPGKPVTRGAERPALEKRLREPPPEKGSAAKDVLQQLQQDVFGNMMHVDHPRFFAFIPSPSNFVSAMADALAAGYNVFSGTWLESSGPTEIELITVDWLRELCGLPETTGGMFVSGGTVAPAVAVSILGIIMVAISRRH